MCGLRSRWVAGWRAGPSKQCALLRETSGWPFSSAWTAPTAMRVGGAHQPADGAGPARRGRGSQPYVPGERPCREPPDGFRRDRPGGHPPSARRRGRSARPHGCRPASAAAGRAPLGAGRHRRRPGRAGAGGGRSRPRPRLWSARAWRRTGTSTPRTTSPSCARSAAGPSCGGRRSRPRPARPTLQPWRRRPDWWPDGLRQRLPGPGSPLAPRTQGYVAEIDAGTRKQHAAGLEARQRAVRTWGAARGDTARLRRAGPAAPPSRSPTTGSQPPRSVATLEQAVADAGSCGAADAVLAAQRLASRLGVRLRGSPAGAADAEASEQHELTPRECQVLELLANGLTNRAIAQTLFHQ